MPPKAALAVTCHGHFCLLYLCVSCELITAFSLWFNYLGHRLQIYYYRKIPGNLDSTKSALVFDVKCWVCSSVSKSSVTSGQHCSRSGLIPHCRRHISLHNPQTFDEYTFVSQWSLKLGWKIPPVSSFSCLWMKSILIKILHQLIPSCHVNSTMRSRMGNWAVSLQG